VASQPLTPKLGTRLAITAGGGARITRVYPGTQAAAAGLQVGDVLVAIDGMEIPARRPEDSEVLARQIRQYKAGSKAVFTLWREGRKLDLTVELEAQPTPPAEVAWWEDVQLEFAVRDVAFDDRVRLQLAPAEQGVLVESSTLAGWAYLAGLRNDDLVQRAGGAPVGSVAELRRARDEAVKGGRDWWVLLVRRRGETFFVELNLKPAKS
jgi:serine protease Do